ncbi:Carbohydrate acetyl esterase/feruloyl esterase precursor [Anatilimnocola aggregata]|uniref:Carbohydrate acetyl esterase/feruloyl esterase n=1 Tax=Anatilimnocola aggregata TaxID=2528021 RepID=A0A517YA04_9BACT|nr:alpha/beta hydrolase-fold protein [Anatilimnocola aggregata]QDU27077.1 Carbohydrate acetyl esterase/feruloyl esterase precursor [Anatilimnocola aggregata]
MHHSRNHSLVCLFALLSVVLSSARSAPAQPKEAPFRWINKLPAERTPLLLHGTFASAANKTDVGYYVYLPPGYEQAKSSDGAVKRFPVIYYLHGGRPGGEHKSISMAAVFDAAINAGRVPPLIYVFVNGGEMSHYDFPEKQSLGETAFVKELIPHIDANYRTIAKREGRGIEGFSQGGRGTARIMFKYPELFCSAAPMGGGHQHERHAAENQGRETSGVQFEPGNNTYDLAEAYAKRKDKFPLRILVGVGKQDFNYEANLDWMRHLAKLEIPYKQAIAGDAPHSAAACYRNLGDQVMLFHSQSFATPVMTK